MLNIKIGNGYVPRELRDSNYITGLYLFDCFRFCVTLYPVSKVILDKDEKMATGDQYFRIGNWDRWRFTWGIFYGMEI